MHRYGIYWSALCCITIITATDFACGTGGFLTSWLKELETKVQTVDDREKLLNSIYGIEKKQFPYILCITNMLLHDIDVPKIYHDNSLLRDVLDYTERDQFDVILMNPPFIRYQYMEKEIQDTAQSFFNAMGMKFTKHTNLWLPFILASVDFLRPGGHIGMIIPSEILNVLYAQGLRDYLLKECKKILVL